MPTACCQRGGTESPTYDFYSAAALLAMQSAVNDVSMLNRMW